VGVASLLVAAACGSSLDTAKVTTDKSSYNLGQPVVYTLQVIAAGTPATITYYATASDTWQISCYSILFIHECNNAEFDFATNVPIGPMTVPGFGGQIVLTVAEHSGPHEAGEDITSCQVDSGTQKCVVSGNSTDQSAFDVSSTGIGGGSVVQLGVHVSTSGEARVTSRPGRSSGN